MTIVTRNKLACRADHVGSLLRPAELLDARDDEAAGRITPQGLHQQEDTAILKALEMQRQSGISVLSDGEYRRATFSEAFTRVTAPFAIAAGPSGPGGLPQVQGTAGLAPGATVGSVMPGWKGPHGGEVVTVTGQPTGRRVINQKLELDRVDRLTAHEVGFLSQHVHDHAFKITMPGAGQFVPQAFEPGVTDRVYASREALAEDVAAIIRREITACIKEGVPYIQLDSLRYVIQLADEDRRAMLQSAGMDLEKELDFTIWADNLSVDGIDREDAVIGLHMCRGNNRSAWSAEGSYDRVAEKTFSQLHVDRFLLEYDDERRQGGFEPLRFVPPDKMVVLGIISSKVPEPESVDVLRRRIDEAAKFHPLEALAISPQCGFASASSGNLLTWDEQRRKLELVAETARLVWG